MSIADLLAQATPQAQYYDYDRKIMEDYDNRAKIYNEAYDKYKKDFEDYQTKVDDFNLLVEQYNTNLADPAFTGTAPVFKGGAEPTAPVDPGFSQGDIDAFIDEATARATRRGQTAATAFNVFQQGGNFATAPQVQGGAGVSTQPEFSFSGSGFADGGVVSPPEDPPVVAPARNEGALGLGYYIPSDLKEFFRRPKERDRGPINAPGFENINSLLRGFNLPYSLVADTGGKTRDAFDPSLPMEERIRKGGEAAIETGIQALLPLFGRMAGQPLSRSIVEFFFPVSTPKSAAEVAVDTVEDMGRRNMLKGTAAATGVAAFLPEAFIEASKKVPAAVTKTAAKAVPISAINSVAENLKYLRRENDKLRELREETLDQIGPSKEANEFNVDIFRNQDEMQNEVEDLFNMVLKPEDLKNATNDSLEELASFHYDVNDGYVDEIVSSTMETMDMQVGKMEPLIREAKARGLDKAKDKNGISMYPNVASLIDEFESLAKPESVDIIQNLPPTVLKMTDEDAAKSTQQLIDELQIRVMREELRDVTAAMKDRGESQQAIENYIRRKRGDIFEAQGLPRDMDDFYAEGGVVENDGSIRALGNLEYEADMRPFLHDSLSQLGFNPDKASYNSQGFNRGDTYTFLSDKINIDPKFGGASQEVQAHEYRHRGLQRLLEDYFMKDPGRFQEKYGTDAYNLMLDVYDESHGKPKNLRKNSVHERIAEYFQKPQKFNMTVLYYTSDGRVFQTEEEVREYVQKNPGVEFMRKEIEGEADKTLETPRVKEFRDYMINKNRGETMRQGTDSEFEAVQSIQKAATDVLSGKYGKGGVVSFAPYLR